MKIMKGLLGVTLFFVFLVTGVNAGGDKKISDAEKDKIKQTMVEYIKANSTSRGVFLIQDAATQKTLRLNFGEVHKAVVKHHDGFLACVDMLDGEAVVDLDFVVSADKGEYRVSKVAIHKVGKEKRKGHLDH